MPVLHVPRVVPALRALGVLTTLVCLAALPLAGAARARVDELARGLGQHLLTVPGATESDPVALQINGLPLLLRSGRSERAPGEVLDELGSRCRSAAGLAELLPAALVARLPEGVGEGVLRGDDGHGGYVACFDPGGAEGRDALVERLGRFAETGDLSALGVLRFAWVQASGQGAHYVAIDGAGPLPLSEAFPEEGDAPGADLPGVPRPGQSRRLLSSGLAGAPPGLLSYQVPGDVGRASAAYLRALEAAGMRVSAPEGGGGWLVETGARLLALTAVDDGKGGTVLSLSPIQ